MRAFHLEAVAYEGFHTETQGIQHNLELVSATQNSEMKSITIHYNYSIGIGNFPNHNIK